MPRRRKKEEFTEFTDREYKTLRKLIALWIKTVAHRKYGIVKNAVIVCLAVTAIFLNFKVDEKVEEIHSLRNLYNIEKAFDLSLYPSIAKKNSNLERRLNYLYKKYLEDKAQPDHFYYNEKKKIKRYWNGYCGVKIRKITNIRARVRDIEVTLIHMFPHKKSEIDKLILEKRYDEKLTHMSNYYARFIPLSKYKFLIKITD